MHGARDLLRAGIPARRHSRVPETFSRRTQPSRARQPADRAGGSRVPRTTGRTAAVLLPRSGVSFVGEPRRHSMGKSRSCSQRPAHNRGTSAKSVRLASPAAEQRSSATSRTIQKAPSPNPNHQNNRQLTDGAETLPYENTKLVRGGVIASKPEQGRSVPLTRSLLGKALCSDLKKFLAERDKFFQD